MGQGRYGPPHGHDRAWRHEERQRARRSAQRGRAGRAATPMGQASDPCVHLSGQSAPFGEPAPMGCGVEALPDHRREWVVVPRSMGLRQGNMLGLTLDRVDRARRRATIGHGDTKNGSALGVPLNEVALAVLQRQWGKHPTHVFTYRGNPLRSANTRKWRAALKTCGIEDFRWHDLRHTWASWLRQNDVRSEEHTSELQSLMRISYAVFCLKKTKRKKITQSYNT